MPKNPVTDPITDQEIAVAHLVLSGTMNDRCAAEAAGLNPDAAAYTKSKPRVRAYMIEHRAAVSEKLADREAEGLRKLNLGRDQILARLWELANLSAEATRGSIAGQIKAISMIVAMEGLIPDRRLAPPQAQSAPEPEPPAEAQMEVSAGCLQPHQQTESRVESKAPRDSRPANNAMFPNLGNNPGPLNPFIYPEKRNWLPATTDYVFDAVLAPAGPLKLSLPQPKRPFARSR